MYLKKYPIFKIGCNFGCEHCNLLVFNAICRKEGIRTLDTVTRILPFQGSSFNHSDTFLFALAKVELFIHIRKSHHEDF